MSYIFLLISLGLLFVNIYIGFVLSIIALIISIINFKNKDFLNIVTLILSSLVIVICIISFISSSFKKNVEISEETLDESIKNSYLTYEQKLESLAKKYVVEDQILNSMMYTGISYIQINKLEQNNSNGCDGYVMYNYDTNTYKAYIKCSDYKTEGYDASKDK